MVPVEITILPAGKSLDVCAEIRERNKTESGKRKKRNKRTKQVANSKAEGLVEEPANNIMFEFLNTRIFKKGMYTLYWAIRIISGDHFVVEKAPSQLQVAKEKSGGSSEGKGSDNVNVKVS